MQTLIRQSSRQKAGRWLAILAMCVMLVGKLVHFGQECDGCCSAGKCVVTSDGMHRTAPCPFGCTHDHGTVPSGSESDEPSGKGHDEHQCAVCSVLSHVTEAPEIVGIPDDFQIVADRPAVAPAFCLQEVFFDAHPRGPPADV